MTNMATNESWRATSGSSGDFVYTRLPIGTYMLAAESKGFKKVVQRGITLNLQANIEVNPVLQLGEFTQSVSVTGDVAQLSTQDADISQVVNGQQVPDLTLKGRRYDTLALLTPAVRSCTSFWQFEKVVDGACLSNYTHAPMCNEHFLRLCVGFRLTLG